MKLAFALFHYFPYGGLERDMLAIAQACVAGGHEVTIYTRAWDGQKPIDIPVVELPVSGWGNHARGLRFSQRLRDHLQNQPADCVIGFNKMPGLDVYFAADVCFAEKAFEERSWLYRLSGRARGYLALEKAVFDVSSKTGIMLISPAQYAPFHKYYSTQSQRLHLLPPGIRKDRMMPDDYDEQRKALRAGYGLTGKNIVLLMVGSDFRRKGLGRSIKALAELAPVTRERVQLWVAGLDDGAVFERQAKALGVAEQLKILGPRDDVPALMWSADLFLHPAHSEAAGAVLLEAMVAGLPVITTDVCGYASYIKQFSMGQVLTDEEADGALAEHIEAVLQESPEVWRRHARTFMNNSDIFSMTQRAVEIIEATARDSRQ